MHLRLTNRVSCGISVLGHLFLQTDTLQNSLPGAVVLCRLRVVAVEPTETRRHLPDVHRSAHRGAHGAADDLRFFFHRCEAMDGI